MLDTIVTQLRNQPVAGAPQAAGLPAEPTALLGREKEIARVCELLCRDDVRLLTLTGPGGVGKSRLGLRAVAMLRGEFADGVGFVALGPVDDLSLVATTIAGALGLAEAGDRAPSDRVRSHLAERQVLLLIDGFEQLLGAAPLLAELLAACPQLKLLITSRAGLEVAGERLFRVPPLVSPPASVDPPQPQALMAFPAAALFVARAQAVDHEFELTPRGARAIGEVCRGLDGLPLAIELAAARVRLLSPEAMVARLDHRLELLTGGRRDVPRRQQTMRAAVAWSYDLLEPDQQRLFRQLSVFAGGCTLEAVDAIVRAQPDGTENVLETTEALLAQSMLVRVDSDDETRVGMLETLHEYASEALEAAGERKAAERAHATWCLELARTADRALWGPQQRTWLDRIERELPNLRTALRHLLDSERGDDAGELAAGLVRFWLVRGHLAEGRSWLEASFAHDRGAATSRARGLSAAARLAMVDGEYTRAGELAERARDAARESGAQQALAHALCTLGLLAYSRGDPAGARALNEQAIAILRTLELPARLADALTRSATGLLWLGDASACATLATEAVELSHAAGDTEGWLYASGVLALAWLFDSEERVAAIIADVLEACRVVGAGPHGARAVYAQGVISLRRGEHARARVQLEEACEIAGEFGLRGFKIGVCLPSLARLHLLAGRPRDAARLLAAADRALASGGASIPPWMRADDGGKLDATRAALADPGLDSAWAEGATLTVEQALAAVGQGGVGSEAGDDGELCALTSRELEVLRLLTRDLTDARIAQELVVSRRTVHAHLRSVYRKLGVGSRLAAVSWAHEHSL